LTPIIEVDIHGISWNRFDGDITGDMGLFMG
jgi:hypothetical protein